VDWGLGANLGGGNTPTLSHAPTSSNTVPCLHLHKPTRLAPEQLARANVRQNEDVAAGGVPWSVYGTLVCRSWPPVLILALALLVFSPLVSLEANLLLSQW